MTNKKKFKRLFFDIETSPNLVFSWNVGYKISLTPDNIVNERQIICICWKFEGEKQVHSLSWDKGNDKKMVTEFAKILNSADEAIGHNSVNYDEKWVRTRAIYHGIPLVHDIHSIDTLKLSRKGFRFNSNKLDYIGQYLGLGKKKDTGGFGLWKSIVLDNDPKSMKKMIDYCKQDVKLLEKVYQTLSTYSTHKTHMGVFKGKSNHSCPNCGSTDSISNGERIMASGLKKLRLQCKKCGKYHSINLTKALQ